jgi:RNA polymerase sigma-70 factor (ECF subfamily)
MALGPAFDEVLGAARSGASWAVTALYRELQPPLLSYLRAQEPGDAEDLASEVWLGVGQGLARFEGDEAAFRGWLFTIARRRIVDLRRQRGRRRTEPTAGEAFAALPASDDPESTALASIRGDAIRQRIVALLPPDQADVVLLRVVGGLDAAQIAAVLGKRPGTVRVLQHRAVRRLAKVLSEESEEGVTP